jgi:small subunit ribosomal protein S8
MIYTDTISDMLSRISNASRQRMLTVKLRKSKMAMNILKVIQQSGFIRGYIIKENNSELEVLLKYYNNQPSIKEVHRVSKPGKKVYKSLKELSLLNDDLTLYILSTTSGVISLKQAKILGVGGEIVCFIR